MDTALQDIWYALRVLRKSPGFTAVSVLTLALGIAGVTFVFTAYSATVWQPLPAQDPGRLIVLARHLRTGGSDPEFSMLDYRRMSDRSPEFSGMAAEGQYDTVLAQFPDPASGRIGEPQQATAIDFPDLERRSAHRWEIIRCKHSWCTTGSLCLSRMDCKRLDHYRHKEIA
jgi:hypothetical protein